MPKLIIAIHDNVADDLAGPITIHHNEATAIRYFSEAAAAPDSYIGRHIADYDLIQLGHLEDDLSISNSPRTILTGKQWAAAQQPTENNK